MYLITNAMKNLARNYKRNLLIAAVILVLGIGGATISIPLGGSGFDITGMALAAIIGIILNKVLPGGQKQSYESSDEVKK